jgi:hypothetical protein
MPGTLWLRAAAAGAAAAHVCKQKSHNIQRGSDNEPQAPTMGLWRQLPGLRAAAGGGGLWWQSSAECTCTAHRATACHPPHRQQCVRVVERHVVSGGGGAVVRGYQEWRSALVLVCWWVCKTLQQRRTTARDTVGITMTAGKTTTSVTSTAAVAATAIATAAATATAAAVPPLQPLSLQVPVVWGHCRCCCRRPPLAPVVLPPLVPHTAP